MIDETRNKFIIIINNFLKRKTKYTEFEKEFMYMFTNEYMLNEEYNILKNVFYGIEEITEYTENDTFIKLLRKTVIDLKTSINIIKWRVV